jgi:hypothetical protein
MEVLHVAAVLFTAVVLALAAYGGARAVAGRLRPARLAPPASCANCALVRGYGAELGCRAEPPRLLADAGVLHSGWPRVRPGDWCARHTPQD